MLLLLLLLHYEIPMLFLNVDSEWHLDIFKMDDAKGNSRSRRDSIKYKWQITLDSFVWHLKCDVLYFVYEFQLIEIQNITWNIHFCFSDKTWAYCHYYTFPFDTWRMLVVSRQKQKLIQFTVSCYFSRRRLVINA